MYNEYIFKNVSVIHFHSSRSNNDESLSAPLSSYTTFTSTFTIPFLRKNIFVI